MAIQFYRHSKKCQKWNFRYAYLPSGNPGVDQKKYCRGEFKFLMPINVLVRRRQIRQKAGAAKKSSIV
jgi:hypothetical protein